MLALSRSKLTTLARIPALRDILAIDIGDVVNAETIDLDVLWELLAEYDSFDAGAAVAPMCALKSWENRFKRSVVLPKPLRGLTSTQIALAAAKCQISPQAVTRALRSGQKSAALAARDIKVFFIRDSTGRIRATAQWFDSPPRIKVQLQ